MSRAPPHVKCKADVMFEDGDDGQRFRQSIVEYCGSTNLSEFLGRVVDAISRLPGELVAAAAEPASILGELVHNAPQFDALDSAEPFAGFFDGVFPHYVAAMQGGNFYLSDLELAALCQCPRRNVAIALYDGEE